ncbi:MAG TPA: SET domain-containing protein-lysine N-methyltransferase [Streptosporangiaceae bacterium]|nr:SET domain-containing protein-lysine N-methyltransferase [Streptosporangiaceae bacterium]
MIGTDSDLPDNFDQLISPGIRSGELYVAFSDRHGRGVFAARDFAANAVLEICPVLVVPVAQRTAVNTTVLFDYCYEWDGGAGLALGFGSLYNHSYEPNAHYRQHIDRGLVIVTALRDIAKDQEITINYRGDPADQSPVWYDQA